MMTPPWRMLVLLTLLALLVGTLVLSVAPAVGPGGAARRTAPMLEPPFLVFRSLSTGRWFGRLALLPLGTPDRSVQFTGLPCVRAHYAAGGGICIVQEQVRGAAHHAAFVFDASFTRGRRISLSGVPTRVRVAPNGSRAAITTFAEEDTATGERLALDSIVVDLPTGRVVADLSEFRVQADGAAILERIDIAGVAFESDGDRFFAAGTTSTEWYLLAGSMSQREMTALRSGVASESLSPDGRHLVVKKLRADGFWQLAVLDLRTWEERELQQGGRSVDDQVEWLDDQHVVYHDADDSTTSIWMLPIDGVNGPRVLVRDAYSPAVQR
jgi:dipeptidyl aminopeptidase/acylaminoacyl peptidase